LSRGIAFHSQEKSPTGKLSGLDSRESFCPRIFVEEVFVYSKTLWVISKTGLVFDPLDSCLRAIFSAIYADQKFGVFANLSLLLEPK